MPVDLRWGRDIDWWSAEGTREVLGEAAGKKVRCKLCPRGCVIAPGKTGFCRARKNEDGELYTLVDSLIV